MQKTQSSIGMTALRGLAHPLSLLAVGLLLLNDHLLKHIAPSVLTGKLSDFAGLFFFPFLAAAVWGLLFERRRPTSRWSAPLIFILTGAWFTAIKTLPWANALTVTILTRLVGPAQIVRDPTDLVALAALWPAWRLWRRLESAPPEPPGRRAVFALALASLATMATSCAPVLHVQRLAVSGNTIYAALSGGYMPEPLIAQSDDGGQTWQSITPEKLSQEIMAELEQPIVLPVTACDSEAHHLCYRVSGAGIVEGSMDGGQTWDVIWKIPLGRRKFAERYQSTPTSTCISDFDLGPYDLALLPTAEGAVLIAAAGNEGGLVRTPDGQWEQHAVLFAAPTPFYGSDLALWQIILWVLLWETGLLVAIASLSSAVLTVAAWKILMTKSAAPAGKPIFWHILPTLWGLLLAIILGAIVFSPLRLDSGAYPIMLSAIPIPILMGVGLSWRRIKRSSKSPEAVARAQWVCGLLPLGVLLAGLPFLLWAWGTIAVYEVALGLAVVIGLSVLGVGVRALRKISTLLNE